MQLEGWMEEKEAAIGRCGGRNGRADQMRRIVEPEAEIALLSYTDLTDNHKSIIALQPLLLP